MNTIHFQVPQTWLRTWLVISMSVATICLAGVPYGRALTVDECEKLNAGSCDYSCDAGKQEVGICEQSLNPFNGPLCCSAKKLEPGHSANTTGNPTGVAATGTGAIGSTTVLEDPLGGLGLVGVISRLIQTFLGMVGALALLVFFYSGVMYMTAGSSDRVKKSIDAMKYAALGLFIIMFAYMIASLYLSVLTGGPTQQQASGPVALPTSKQ